MERDEAARRAELNGAELWRDVARGAGGEIYEHDGLLFTAGPSVHLCSVMRTGGQLEAAEVLARSDVWFASRGGVYSVTVELPDDEPLAGACVAAGRTRGWEEYAMWLPDPPAPGDAPSGTAVAVVRTPDEAASFARVVVEANDEVESERARLGLAHPESVLAPHVTAFLAADESGPVGTAMTMVSHGVAGVYWVATVARARRRGVADALTRAAARAGFDAGAGAVWLGASAMGRAIYERIGFRPLGRSMVEFDAVPPPA